MASPVPAKSQPLHNFDLPRTLKWNKDGKSTNNHHRRRSIKSPSRRPNPSPASPLRHSPLRDSISATPPHRESPLRDSAAPRPFSRESPDYSVRSSPIRGESSSKWGRQSPIGGGDSVKGSPIRGDSVCHLPRRDSGSESSGKSKGVVLEYRRSHHSKNPGFDGLKNGGVNSLKSERFTQRSEKKPKSTEFDSVGIKRSSKILIKITSKNNKSEEEISDDKSEEKIPKEELSDEGNHTDQVQEEGRTENNNNGTDEEAKTWNLRPRKPIRKSLNVNGVGIAVKNNGSAVAEKGKAQSPSKNMNNKSGENGGVEKEKRKLSVYIALTKDEIEEDIYAFTGLKPARRPKKRPRNIQKQVDFVFPGLWLVSITPDSYKVSENSMKG